MGERHTFYRLFSLDAAEDFEVQQVLCSCLGKGGLKEGVEGILKVLIIWRSFVVDYQGHDSE